MIWGFLASTSSLRHLERYSTATLGQRYEVICAVLVDAIAKLDEGRALAPLVEAPGTISRAAVDLRTIPARV